MKLGTQFEPQCLAHGCSQPSRHDCTAVKKFVSQAFYTFQPLACITFVRGMDLIHQRMQQSVTAVIACPGTEGKEAACPLSIWSIVQLTAARIVLCACLQSDVDGPSHDPEVSILNFADLFSACASWLRCSFILSCLTQHSPSRTCFPLHSQITQICGLQSGRCQTFGDSMETRSHVHVFLQPLFPALSKPLPRPPAPTSPVPGEELIHPAYRALYRAGGNVAN